MNTLRAIILSAVVSLACNVALAYDYGYDPAKAQGRWYMELAQDPTYIASGLYAGKYEYFFDLYIAGTGNTSMWFYSIVGLDNSKIANAQTLDPDGNHVKTQQWGESPDSWFSAQPTWSDATGRIYDLWSTGMNSTVEWANEPNMERSSYSDFAGGWIDSGLGYAGSSTSNPHDYNEYVPYAANNPNIWKAELTGPGQALQWQLSNNWFGAEPSEDMILIMGTNYYWMPTGAGGVVATVRVVYDEPIDPLTIGWGGSTKENPVLGDFTVPLPPDVPGDFDDDGDVDADDINDLCANITGSGNPPNDPKYDLDGDNDTDQDDMDMLIHDLVEITGGDGTGTEYGDFDLDGDIDTTDLTILATNYGMGTTWALGNANCDLVIDTTDLTIMATNFGFVASGAVPEPATLFVMGCGAIGLLRRRRRT